MTNEFLSKHYQISPEILALTTAAEEELTPQFTCAAQIAEFNQLKVLRAFHDHRVSYAHFAETSGYGYDDMGRDCLDKIYAQVFGAEEAYVRSNIISGTQAIALCLFGVLRPGDTLLAATGKPYDTLTEVIGICPNGHSGNFPTAGSADPCDGLHKKNIGSLADLGVKYKQVDLPVGDAALSVPQNNVGNAAFGIPQLNDVYIKKLQSTISSDPTIKAILIQRSKGYEWQNSRTVAEIGEIIAAAKSANPNVICIVDNCYGEFTETLEPTEVEIARNLGIAGSATPLDGLQKELYKADLVVGSLIKNPGGSLAPTGGYIAGKAKYVELAAHRHTAPGLGAHVGASLGFNKQLYQGLFMAPHIVLQSVKSALLAAKVFEKLDFEVCPTAEEARTDIIQAIKFGDKDKLIAFCRAIQAAAPVDSFVTPEPWAMPGYDNEVIMAAGAFVQGASIELSADAPIKPPFVGFLQGGITYESAKLGVMLAAQAVGANDERK